MRIVLILFLFVFSFSMETNIVNVKKDFIFVNQKVKKGTSGIVLCPYNNEKIICARCISLGDKKAKLYVYKNLKNPAFALPLVYPKKGDKVIFGKNYNRIVIIAPNQEIYLKLKEKYQNNFIIIPIDVFGAFLDDIPTKKDFISFARKMDIGFFVFALDKIYFVDGESFYMINSKNYDFKVNLKFKKPFYSSYDYDVNLKNPIDYYKHLIKE